MISRWIINLILRIALSMLLRFQRSIYVEFESDIDERFYSFSHSRHNKAWKSSSRIDDFSIVSQSANPIWRNIISSKKPVDKSICKQQVLLVMQSAVKFYLGSNGEHKPLCNQFASHSLLSWSARAPSFHNSSSRLSDSRMPSCPRSWT